MYTMLVPGAYGQKRASDSQTVVNSHADGANQPRYSVELCSYPESSLQSLSGFSAANLGSTLEIT